MQAAGTGGRRRWLGTGCQGQQASSRPLTPAVSDRSRDADSRLVAVRVGVKAAEADVFALESRVHIAQVALDNCKVRAPFTGTITRKLTEVGEVLSPTPMPGSSSSGGIASLASLDDLEVEADVSETQLYKVMTPERKQEGTPAEIVLDAYPDRRFRGLATDVRPTVDRAKATVVVKVRFVDKVQGVLPDMSAKVSFLHKAIEQSALAAAPKRVIPPTLSSSAPDARWCSSWKKAWRTPWRSPSRRRWVTVGRISWRCRMGPAWARSWCARLDPTLATA